MDSALATAINRRRTPAQRRRISRLGNAARRERVQVLVRNAKGEWVKGTMLRRDPAV